jgi:hypothetical protein
MLPAEQRNQQVTLPTIAQAVGNCAGGQGVGARQAMSMLGQGLCHIVALSLALLRRYSKHLKLLGALRKALAGTPVLSLIMNADFTSKVLFIPDPPAVHKEGQVPDDVPVVRLADAAQSMLVTTDSNLRHRLDRSSIATENRIHHLRPEDALPYARTRNS